MIDDTLKLTGELTLRLTRVDGSVETRHIPNLVVTRGKEVAADRQLVVPTHAAMSHMAVGTGGAAPAVTDTMLMFEVPGSRVPCDSIDIAGTKLTYSKVFGPGVGTGALIEAGIFNDPVAGDMLARTVFPVVNKGPDDNMVITWNVTVG